MDDQSKSDYTPYLPQLHPDHPFANFYYPPALLAQWIIIFILMVIGFIYLNKAAYKTPEEIVAAQIARGQAPETEAQRQIAHENRVTSLAKEIADLHRSRTSFRIHHGSTNSTRTTRSSANKIISTRHLRQIVSINRTTMTCLCEPNVPMDALLQSCTDQSLLPKVVPEFPGITVGGAFAGTAGESASFKYGFFDNTVSSIEIVLATGEVVRASPIERADLFSGAAGTFGTLGVITLLEVQLLDITDRKMVRLTYHPVTSMTSARHEIVRACANEANDFIDGILFSPSSGVIMTGRLDPGPKFIYPPPPPDPDNPDPKISTFLSAVDPWFYLHAQRVLRHQQLPHTELVPLHDYIFRYNRGAFWTGRHAFTYFLVPFNALTRWASDYFMHTRVMYHALHASGLAQRFIIQDCALPPSTVVDFVDWCAANTGIWPLWLCPLKTTTNNGLRVRQSPTNTRNGEMLINVGIWGPVPRSSKDFVTLNRALESQVKNYKGTKWLYAQTFYTEEEFWDVYDKRWYDGVRKKWNAEDLPSVHEKVAVEVEKEKGRLRGIWGVWPSAGLWGVLSVVKAAIKGEIR